MLYVISAPDTERNREFTQEVYEWLEERHKDYYEMYSTRVDTNLYEEEKKYELPEAIKDMAEKEEEILSYRMWTGLNIERYKDKMIGFSWVTSGGNVFFVLYPEHPRTEGKFVYGWVGRRHGLNGAVFPSPRAVVKNLEGVEEVFYLTTRPDLKPWQTATPGSYPEWYIKEQETQETQDQDTQEETVDCSQNEQKKSKSRRKRR